MAKIMLRNVRLSFPSLFQKAEFNGEQTKYEATFLLPKSDVKTYDIIMDAIGEAVKAAKIKMPPPDKLFIKDGDLSDYDGYADHWSIKSSNGKRPTVVDKDKSPLTEDDNVIYSGCYVNAQIDLWVQNNNYGKRANSNLLIVQMNGQGEPFGAGGGSGDLDAFEEIDGNDFDDEIPF